MKDEKNKQQQPQHTQQGNTGQKPSSGQQPTGQSPSGQQSPGQHPAGKHPTGKDPVGQDPSRMPHNNPRRSDKEQPMDVNEGDIENPDQQEQPGKKANIDDDPAQTKKKVPNMNK